jgi:hypothetical protein
VEQSFDRDYFEDLISKLHFSNTRTFESMFTPSANGVLWGYKIYPTLGYEPDQYDSSNHRGLYGLDVETKEHTYSVITNDYTVEIRPDFLADTEDNIIFIDIVPPWPEFNHFVIYSIKKNEIIFKSREFGSQFFPFKDKAMFYSKNIRINDNAGLLLIYVKKHTRGIYGAYRVGLCHA